MNTLNEGELQQVTGGDIPPHIIREIYDNYIESLAKEGSDELTHSAITSMAA